MTMSIAALRLKNRLMTGDISGPQLQIDLASSNAMGALRELLAHRHEVAILMSNPISMASITSSALALNTLSVDSGSFGVAVEVMSKESSLDLRKSCYVYDFYQKNNLRNFFFKNLETFNFLLSTSYSRDLFTDLIKNGDSYFINSCINSKHVLDYIFSKELEKGYFKNNSSLPPISVPKMTNTGSPSGLVTSSTQNTSYRDYNAFDKNLNSVWISSSGLPQWVAYQFTKPVYIHTLSLATGVGGTYAKNVSVFYKNDNNTWIEVKSFDVEQSANLISSDIVAAGRHRDWRLQINSNLVTSNQLAYVFELDFIGFQ